MNKKQINQGEAQVVKEVKRLLTPYFKENAINRIDVDFKIRGLIAEAERRGKKEAWQDIYDNLGYMLGEVKINRRTIIDLQEHYLKLSNQTEDK